MNETVTYGSSLLQEKFCKLFAKDTNSVLTSRSFTDLTQAPLCAFLDVDHMNVVEIVLFCYIKKWMRKTCEAQGIATNGQNMRHVIDDALFKIRFPTMNVQDFANTVCTIDGFHTDIEKSQVFLKITIFNNRDIACPFSSEFRCRNESLYTAFRDMTHLLQQKVLFQLKVHEFHDTCHSVTFIVLVNSHQR